MHPIHRSVTFVCFACRRSFKLHRDRNRSWTSFLRGVDVCSECRGPTTNVGTKFHVPPRSKKKEWARVEWLVRRGTWCLLDSATTLKSAKQAAEALFLRRDADRLSQQM